MSNWIEALEIRSLLSASISPTLAADYQVVLNDNVAVKAAARNLATLVTVQNALIQKDVKALGKSNTNAALFASLKKAELQYEAPVKADTTRYLAAAGRFRQWELAEAAFEDIPAAAITRKWKAAQLAALQVDSLKLGPLGKLYSPESIAAVNAQIDALDTANGSTGTLDTDLQKEKIALANQVQANALVEGRAYYDVDILYDGESLY